MDIEVNYLAVLVAAIVAMVVGFIYYLPAVVGKAWIKEMGHTDKSMKDAQSKMGAMYTVSFVLALVTAYVLSHVITMSVTTLGYDRQMSGLTSAIFMWVGFVAPVQATDVLFGGRSWKLFLINTGYQLLSMLGMGAVLGYWEA